LGEDQEVVADTFSVPHSGPRGNTSSALDEPRSGIQSEESDIQSPIQQSENLEELNNLISAASCRRKIIKEKIGHELAILLIERQAAEQRLFLLSKLNENPSSTTTIALELSASPVSQVVEPVEKKSLPEKQLAAVFNAKELLVLTDIVTASLADRFKDQFLRPGFSCD
jgi:hypothetical protein